MRVLLTGFEPFGRHVVNPTQLLVEGFRPSPELRTLVLPVTLEGAFVELERAIAEHRPDAVVAFGLAGGRSAAVEIERVGLNVLDFDIADNSGRQPVDEPIEREGPLARGARLPARKIVEALRAREIPARISNSAGTYVCNYLLYRLLGTNVPVAGFVHLPYLPEQGTPSMTLETMRETAEVILATIGSSGA